MAATAVAQQQQQQEQSYTLSYRHCFGVKNNVRNNLHFFDETQVLYPAGHTTVLYYIDQKVQRFFPGTDGTEEITCLAISPNKKYLAVAEKANVKIPNDKPIITIYDVQTCKKRKTCCYLDIDCVEVVALAFDQYSRFLLTQYGTSPSGKHDWTLVYWAWDKAKPIAATKVGTSPINEVSFNPIDSSTVFCIGDAVFKFLKVQESDGCFRTIPFQLTKIRGPQNYLCHVWLQDDRLVVGCENGELLLFDNAGELSEVITKGETGSLRCLEAFTKGFVTGGDIAPEKSAATAGLLSGMSNTPLDGLLCVYEKTDEKSFHKSKEIKLEGGGIRSVTISPSEETLAVATSNSQIFKLSLVSSDLINGSDSSKSLFEPMLTSFHSGSIHGLDVCLRKPIVVTCGADKTVRVWNYQERTCELMKQFNEEAFSVALHPSGFHLIVGFTDKLRAMNLLMEDFRTYKEMPVKGCREVRFSNGGQLFAAVNGNNIQVYKTYTCEMVSCFGGGNSRMKSICWGADDSVLSSCSADGAIYEFSVILDPGKRLSDWVSKGTNFSCVLLAPAPATGQAGALGSKNTMYAVGSDRMIKEVRGSQLISYLETGIVLGQIALGSGAMFASVAEPDSSAAPLRIYRFPLGPAETNASGPLQYACHSGAATRLRVTYDDAYLFSVAEDGCLFIFDVKKKGAKDKANKKEREGVLPFADEILVTRTFLDDKQAQLQELERQVEELLNQIEFQLSHRDSYHKEKMAELEERYGQEIEQERAKYEVLLQEKNDMDGEYEDHIQQMEETHQKQLQELESSFQHKMQIEISRHQKLSGQREKEQAMWSSTMKELLELHAKKVDTDTKQFEAARVEDAVARQRILEEKVEEEKIHRETLQQLEQDADREIEELKDHYEYKLAQEKDDKVRLRGQAGIHRKHHEDLKRQMNKKEEELKLHMEEAKKKQDRIEQLLREREHNIKEIKERDKTIHDKEQKIFELKKQNQELEKFKFVLDYKIKELKAQIDPKNDDIAAMKRDIQGMDADLEEYHRKNKLLQQDITSLQSKQRGLVDEICLQRRKLGASKMYLSKFASDLHETYKMVDDGKFKEAFVTLYKKYQDNDPAELADSSNQQDMSSSSQKEYTRQKEYLEKTIDSLKRSLKKDSETHRLGNMRIMQEQVELIREINELRKEISYLKHEKQLSRLGGDPNMLATMAEAGGATIGGSPPPPKEEVPAEG